MYYDKPWGASSNVDSDISTQLPPVSNDFVVDSLFQSSLSAFRSSLFSSTFPNSSSIVDNTR